MNVNVSVLPTLTDMSSQMEWDNHIQSNLKKLVKFLFFTKTPPPSLQRWCYALDHFPEIIDDIGQAVGVDDQGDGFAEDDNSHVAFEGHIGQTCQHTDEVGRTNWPDHHEDKEAIEPLAFIEPANVLVIGLLTDHGLDELRPVHSRKVENNGTADHDTDVIVDSPNDVTVDENTCYRCQGTGNNRDHCLKDLKKDKERWSKNTCLQNKS